MHDVHKHDDEHDDHDDDAADSQERQQLCSALKHNRGKCKSPMCRTSFFAKLIQLQLKL